MLAGYQILARSKIFQVQFDYRRYRGVVEDDSVF